MLLLLLYPYRVPVFSTVVVVASMMMMTMMTTTTIMMKQQYMVDEGREEILSGEVLPTTGHASPDGSSITI